MAEINFIVQEEAILQLRRERVFLDRANPLENLNDQQLITDYRFPRQSIMKIIEICKLDLERRTNRNHALPVHIQVLTALRFYAKGLFQNDVKGIIGLSQSCISRVIRAVSKCLSSKANQFIRFPETEHETRRTKTDFFNLAEFPNIIGAVDGTLINIQTPSGPQEPLYVGRKGGHALNIQIICNAKMQILDIVAKWPGTTHDSFIWKNSGLRAKFSENPPIGWLIGDSGYPIEPWLLTPLANAIEPKHIAYNKCHVKTRRIVENTIGLWKNVFRRIDKTGGILIYTPERACSIIVATAVLHNMRRSLRLPEDEAFQLDEYEEGWLYVEPGLSDNATTVEGNFIRNTLINSNFT